MQKNSKRFADDAKRDKYPTLQLIAFGYMLLAGLSVLLAIGIAISVTIAIWLYHADPMKAPIAAGPVAFLFVAAVMFLSIAEAIRLWIDIESNIRNTNALLEAIAEKAKSQP